MASPTALRLLVDTDAFCKLAVGRVLDDAVGHLGANLTECGRLPALPHMLRRGRLRALYGSENCDTLLPLANAMLPLVPSSGDWLDRLTPYEDIDPGEAQIFAAGAESGLLIVSGDKRALHALKNVTGYPAALADRIVVLEAIMIALCDNLGVNEVRQRFQALATSDKMVQVCFSSDNHDPVNALLSYYQRLASELAPLVLWNPRPGGLR